MELWDIYDGNRKKTGRIHERGKPMNDDDYHIVVHVWILNSNNEFLITKRSPGKIQPDVWESTGGSAMSGETSLYGAIRETKEETGLILDVGSGKVVLSYKRHRYKMPDFFDVWLFRQDFDINDVVMQPGETCDAMWASADIIKNMIAMEEFSESFEYIDEIFKYTV